MPCDSANITMVQNGRGKKSTLVDTSFGEKRAKPALLGNSEEAWKGGWTN